MARAHVPRCAARVAIRRSGHLGRSPWPREGPAPARCLALFFQFFSYDNNNNNYNKTLTYEAVFHTFITPHSLIMSPQCLGILLAQCELG